MPNDPFNKLWNLSSKSIQCPTIPIENFTYTRKYYEVDGLFICRYCEKNYKLQKSMLSHIEKEHSSSG